MGCNPRSIARAMSGARFGRWPRRLDTPKARQFVTFLPPASLQLCCFALEAAGRAGASRLSSSLRIVRAPPAGMLGSLFPEGMQLVAMEPNFHTEMLLAKARIQRRMPRLPCAESRSQIVTRSRSAASNSAQAPEQLLFDNWQLLLHLFFRRGELSRSLHI